MKLETRSVVVLSTAHVCEATAHGLEAGVVPALYSNEYGWLVDATRVIDQPPDFEGCDDLTEVARWARKNGFDWVEFDRDAETIEALPVYDW